MNKMTEPTIRILPELNDLNRFFWTSGADGNLKVLQCSDCKHWLHPPGIICPQCQSRKLVPQPVSGMATIEAVTINHQSWGPGQNEPYVIAIVNLDEQKGLNLTTNIIGCTPDSVHIGQRVRLVFEQHEDVYLPLLHQHE